MPERGGTPERVVRLEMQMMGALVRLDKVEDCVDEHERRLNSDDLKDAGRRGILKGSWGVVVYLGAGLIALIGLAMNLKSLLQVSH